jgi:hypothetical protein
VTITGYDPALTGSDSATLAVQAVNSFPQFINVPVTLTLANSSGTSGLLIPQVVDGGAWQTTFGVTNTNATTATATLRFHQQTDTTGDTQGWTPPLLEAVSTQNMQLAPGATIFLHTPGTAPTLTEGFAELIAGAGVLGYAIFTQRIPGRTDQDATAMAAAPGGRILVPFDNSGLFVTAIAVVNASGSTETLSATLRLASGSIAESPLSIPALGHAVYVAPTAFPNSSGLRGTLDLSCSTGTFSVIGLRFNPTGAFTTLPVYVVNALPSSPSAEGPEAGATAGPRVAPMVERDQAGR